MTHKHIQPEDHIYHTQYRFLPRQKLYFEVDDSWIDIVNLDDFDIQEGYELSAPDSMPAGCQSHKNRGTYVPREWEFYERLDREILEFMKNYKG